MKPALSSSGNGSDIHTPTRSKDGNEYSTRNRSYLAPKSPGSSPQVKSSHSQNLHEESENYTQQISVKIPDTKEPSTCKLSRSSMHYT